MKALGWLPLLLAISMSIIVLLETSSSIQRVSNIRSNLLLCDFQLQRPHGHFNDVSSGCCLTDGRAANTTRSPSPTPPDYRYIYTYLVIYFICIFSVIDSWGNALVGPMRKIVVCKIHEWFQYLMNSAAINQVIWSKIKFQKRSALEVVGQVISPVTDPVQLSIEIRVSGDSYIFIIFSIGHGNDCSLK